MSGHATVSGILDASADDVFSTLTEISRLPDWNTAIAEVSEQPDHLEVGAQWIVQMHVLAQSWPSRSSVEEFDPTRRRFAYRSVTDDGNPSYALWTWEVADHPDGALVTVAFELHPRTFWRRVLLARIRARQLARTELPHSLTALEAAAKRSARPR